MRHRAWWQTVMTAAVCLMVATISIASGQAGSAGAPAPAGLQFKSEDGTGGPSGPEAVSERYLFSASSGTYAEIAGGTVHGTNANDDQNFMAVDLGFTFRFDGTDYTQVSIQSNGWVALGATVASSYVPISGGSINNLVAALALDLEGNGTTSEIMSLMEGSAPNRVFTIQWKHYKRYSSGTAYDADDFNFQVKLYESTNQLQVVYGTFAAATAATPPTVQVGLRGASNADFNNRMTDATHFWADSLAGTANTSAMALTDAILPASGLTYAWTAATGLFLNPAAQTGSGCKGSDVVYTLTVENATGAPLTVNLAYSSVWPATGPATTGLISHNASENVTVTVHIPWTAAIGDSDVLTVTATEGTGTYSDTATATTQAGLASGWQDYANLPTARATRNHALVYAGGKLYKIGGYNGAATVFVDIFDIATNTWSTGADLPAARYWIDCEEISGKIYCAGGYVSSGQSTLYIYDIAANTWGTGTAMPANRYNYASAKVGGKYYVLGGYTTAVTNTILAYDPVANTWDSTLPVMSAARRYFQAGVIGGQIYVAGGYTGSTYTTSTEAYDPVANSWTAKAAMPAGWVQAADGVKHDRYLVLAGGYYGATATASNTALFYDSATDSWALLPYMSHILYGSEGDGDGTHFWMASGRLYEGSTFSYSAYTSQLVQCETSCIPVSGPDFTYDPPVPVGGPITYTASVAAGSPPITYGWDFGDGQTGTGQVVTHTFAGPGTYNVVLTVTNCDGASTANVAHQVTIPALPAVSLVKTVGTVAGVCAATDAITVAAGTPVYYCYQVENTGNVTFELHDLADTVLGQVLTNLPYTLVPGAFSPEVIVPDTATATVTNSATWTAKPNVSTSTFVTTTISWVDITTTGTSLALVDDGEANITIPFPFTLFDTTSSNLRVGNNGGILFGITAGDLSTANVTLPAATPANAILPFWDDIDADTGDVYWEVQGVAPNRTLVVEWYNRPHYSNIGSGTFEVILYETTNAIKFQYLDTDFGNASYNAGVSATVGLNQNASAAVLHSFNAAVITDGLALLYTPAPYYTASSTDSATVTVEFPNINVDPLTMSATLFPSTTTTQVMNVGNTGAAPLSWEILETLPDRPTRPGIVAAPEPVFNVPDRVSSKADCAAFENYPGREPEGWAEFCGQPAGAPIGQNSPNLPTSTGFAQDIGYVSDNFVSFTLNNFTGQTVVGTSTNAYYGMDFDPMGTTLYALNDTTDMLGTIDLVTGAFTPLVSCPAGGGAANWTGLAIDPVTGTFYASTPVNLYTIDPTTGASTLVGPFVNSTLMIAIAVSPTGAMYGHDISTDSIYTIDTATGTATLVGPTGYAANYAQGMDFDNEDGTLYIFLYIGSGVNHYGTVNLTTGAVTVLATSAPQGEFEGATRTLAACVPNDYSWLSTSPITGSVAAGGLQPVNVTYDSTGLTCGQTYPAQLCVRSNDPDAPPGNGTMLVQVPVSLYVPCAAMSIALTKTVGTTPAVCAGTSAIDVTSGTTVYYCYTVTNTGTTPLTTHDLTDDVLGSILTGQSYTLDPGATVNTVTLGVNPTGSYTVTTTNIGTWTAHDAAGAPTQATGTATVNIIVPVELQTFTIE
ncbi:MAG: PKD domain-containing protein [Acidobacteria bacterium]|nr:PKD domain-containing protein [Acidobacteriota bacterium]